MEELNETVRRVANGLLDTQIAYDPDRESENAIDLTIRNLMAIPGVMIDREAPGGGRTSDVTGLLSGFGLLLTQVIGRLAEAEGKPRELIVAELREWVDRTLQY